MLDTKKTNRTTRSAAAKVLLAALMFCGTEALTSRIQAAEAAAPQAAPAAPATQPAADSDAVNLLTTGLDPTGGKITLVVGQTRLLKSAVPLQTIDVTQPDTVVVNLIPKSNDIVVTGNKPGSTQLVIWDLKGRAQSIEVIISADLASLTAELTKVFPDLKVEVTAANGAIVLHGRVPNAQIADQIVAVAGPYAGKSKIVNMLEIGGGQQVMLQVRFAEVSKDATTALGINWGIAGGVSQFGGSVPGQVAPIGITQLPGTINPVLSVPSPGSNVTQFGSFIAGRTPFEVFLTALRTNNLLRVLAEPNLTVVSGEQASFLAGGEFPYPVPQSNGSGGTTITIEYKPYGVRLNFTPVVLGDGRIRLHVSPEVSDLDYSNAVTLNGFVIPGLTKRDANTTVELAEGQTLSLAGLLNTRVNATSQVTPILGDIPILGALFRSVRYEHLETELIVLVTPRLVSGVNPGQMPAITGEHWRYPTEPQVWATGDLSGPALDSIHTPASTAPKQFEGSYGFSPVAPAAATK
jgi:pilus assembly protein CpaC